MRPRQYMSKPPFHSLNTPLRAVTPSREPLRKARTEQKENQLGRRLLPPKSASVPGPSGRLHSRGEIHPSDPQRRRRRLIRGSNAADAEQATLQDERRRDNSQKLPACPRDNPAAERASIHA